MKNVAVSAAAPPAEKKQLRERKRLPGSSAYRILVADLTKLPQDVEVALVPSARTDSLLKALGLKPSRSTSRASSTRKKPPPTGSFVAASDAYELGPKAKAVLRGREIIAQDLRAADGAYDLNEVMGLLGITKQAISKRVDEDALLAVPGPEGRRRFPAAQFGRDGIVPPGLKTVLKALPSRSPWFRLNFLVNPNAYLNGDRPLDVLFGDGVEKAVDAARRFGEQGA